MKKISFLLVIIFLIILSSCASEQDTRLVCDCDYTITGGSKTVCYSTNRELNNNSLVFNESKKKLMWRTILISSRSESTTKFSEDSIRFSSSNSLQKRQLTFDRTSLVLREEVQGFVAGIEPEFLPPSEFYYQCRVVDGV